MDKCFRIKGRILFQLTHPNITAKKSNPIQRKIVNKIYKIMKILIVLLGLVVASHAAPSIPNRIVGGLPATSGEFPYMVSFQYFSGHMCGGAIVTENHIVTAAHCCIVGDRFSFRVVAGELILNTQEGTEQIVQISTITIHPAYDPNRFDNDVCVLALATKLNFTTPFVQPIKMAETNADPQGDSTVIGWGYEQEDGSISNILRKVTVPLITNAVCKIKYTGSGVEITDDMICAGIDAGGKDSCQHDSGGPLTAINVNGTNTLVGVVSWGNGCARPNYPGVYARVSFFRNWLDNVIANTH